jgi:YesN/AraC family two-component response regulator
MLDLERSLTFANVAYASMALWGLFGRMIFPNASKESDVLEKSVQYMHDNLSKELSLSEIAIQSRLSPSRFSTLFKQHFETSPIDYLIHLRIQRACRYLQLSGMKIHEIAKQVGYEDPYYFSRVFSRVMGMSPSHFRKQ